MVEGDQLDAAAADIAHDAIGVRNARDDAEGGQAALLLARQYAHLEAAHVGDRGDEVGAVHGLAYRRRRHHVDQLDLHGTGQRHVALERGPGEARAVGIEPAGDRQAAAEPAQHALIEYRRRCPAQSVVRDHAHRVRPDIDDRNRTARGVRPGLEAAGLSHHVYGLWWTSSGPEAALRAFPRPDRLGLVIKNSCALKASAACGARR